MIGRDEKVALQVLPKVLIAAEAGWMVKTTADNLELLLELRKEKEDIRILEKVIRELKTREKELDR